MVVNDAGLRDGLQNQPRLVSTADKIRLLKALLAAGIRHVEATSFVSPKTVPQMTDADAVYGHERIDYSALVPNVKGYQRAVVAGARSVAVVLSATETMSQRNINMSLGPATAAAEAVMAPVRQTRVTARAYIAVAFERPFGGVTPPDTVLRLADRMAACGTDEIIIADTICATGPDAVARPFGRLANSHPLSRLTAHVHDTRGLAAANAYAAIVTGIWKFDSAIGGLGGCPFAPGAAGNLATEDLVYVRHAGGYETGIDLTQLETAVECAECCVGISLGGRWLAWRRSQRAREIGGCG